MDNASQFERLPEYLDGQSIQNSVTRWIRNDQLLDVYWRDAEDDERKFPLYLGESIAVSNDGVCLYSLLWLKRSQKDERVNREMC